jgi:hypothetical protein
VLAAVTSHLIYPQAVGGDIGCGMLPGAGPVIVVWRLDRLGRKAPNTIHLPVSCLPRRDELGLIQPHDRPGEWWVTLNHVAVIGFSGVEPRTRAEQHFRELLDVAVPRAAEPNPRPAEE